MNKIGTITFHWATNYGAVMQSYALQKYILKLNYKTEIINYVPFRVRLIQNILNIKNINFNFLQKEYMIKKFRKAELIISKRYYGSNKKLYNHNKYNTIICGSDQIWNESFTNFAEGKPTLSYFLNFADNTVKRISYAVSFGTNQLSEGSQKLILPELKKFSKISVREKTGKEILNKMNIDSQVVVDPTFLLSKEDYVELIKNRPNQSQQKVFSYIIHNNQNVAIKTSDYVKSKYNEDSSKKYYDVKCGIYEWLYSIKNAKMVVTNSFHGMVFSIIFNTPFIVIPVENSGMNDRITTLLSGLGLLGRIVEDADFSAVDRLIDEKIDWDMAEEKLENLKIKSQDFLSEALS